MQPLQPFIFDEYDTFIRDMRRDFGTYEARYPVLVLRRLNNQHIDSARDTLWLYIKALEVAQVLVPENAQDHAFNHVSLYTYTTDQDPDTVVVLRSGMPVTPSEYKRRQLHPDLIRLVMASYVTFILEQDTDGSSKIDSHTPKNDWFSDPAKTKRIRRAHQVTDDFVQAFCTDSCTDSCANTHTNKQARTVDKLGVTSAHIIRQNMQDTSEPNLIVPIVRMGYETTTAERLASHVVLTPHSVMLTIPNGASQDTTDASITYQNQSITPQSGFAVCKSDRDGRVLQEAIRLWYVNGWITEELKSEAIKWYQLFW